MSTINVLYSAVTESFDFQKIDLSPYYVDIYAGIKKHLDVIPFSGLSFGYELHSDGQLVASRTWPDPGVTYIRTDQEIIDGERVDLNPNTEYTLKVWFINWGQYYEGTDTFTSPSDPVAPREDPPIVDLSNP